MCVDPAKVIIQCNPDICTANRCVFPDICVISLMTNFLRSKTPSIDAFYIKIEFGYMRHPILGRFLRENSHFGAKMSLSIRILINFHEKNADFQLNLRFQSMIRASFHWWLRNETFSSRFIKDFSKDKCYFEWFW